MLTETISRLRAMRPGTRLATLLCAAAVACCLALPPDSEIARDGMLFAARIPAPTPGRPNRWATPPAPTPPPACCTTAPICWGWTPPGLRRARPVAGPDAGRAGPGRRQSPLRRRGGQRRRLGLLADADAARLRAALDGSGYLLTAQDGPAGLTAYSLAPGPVPEEQPADAGPAGALT